MYSLYHIAKADFLQRIRSVGFLITLGVGIYLTLTFIPDPYANYSTVNLGNYQGAFSSSWIGTVTAMMASIFLSLTGFFLVNNNIDRDHKTGVGQIIATTKITRLKYIAGKALTNSFVLISLMLIMALTATVFVLAHGNFQEFSAVDLYFPFIWITLPALVFIAALAAFTECYRKLNRGIVNISFIFLFVFFIALSEAPTSGKTVQIFDIFGTSQAFDVIKNELGDRVKDYNGQHSIGYSFDHQSSDINIIRLSNLHPEFKIVFYRLFWIFLGSGLVLIGTMSFKRFDPAIEPHRNDRTKEIEPNLNPAKYTSLPKPKLSFSPLPLIKAEGKIMLKGVPLWWWVLTLGLFTASVLTDLSITHKYILPLLLLLQINIWSVLGSREKIYGTKQIVFTAPKVLSRQLFAGWGAGILWGLFLSSATIFRLVLEYNFYGVFAIITGIIFIVTLALSGGIFTGGTKLFQMIYVIMFYGLIQKFSFLDYLGTTSKSFNLGMPFILLGISVVMLFLCWIGRRKQSFL